MLNGVCLIVEYIPARRNEASGTLAHLIFKLIGTMESVERLPQYLYDTVGGSPLGLQLLSRRLRLAINYGHKENSRNSEVRCCVCAHVHSVCSLAVVIRSYWIGRAVSYAPSRLRLLVN